MIAAAGDHAKYNINDIQENSPAASGDVPKKKSNAGRKNRGLTEKHYEEYKREKREVYQAFYNMKQSDSFNPDIIERVAGEIINENDIDQFKELYAASCYTALEEFKQNNPELIKQHPHKWYKRVFLDIKKNTPKIDIEDIDKLAAAWEVLSGLLYEIGLYPTAEMFYYTLGLYDYQLKNRVELNSKYADLLQKIRDDNITGLKNELAFDPFTQTNKIFLAKVAGIVEQTEPKQIEVNHNIRNINDIPTFGMIDDKKS